MWLEYSEREEIPKVGLERWARATSHRASWDTRTLDFILNGMSHWKVLRREVIQSDIHI